MSFYTCNQRPHRENCAAMTVPWVREQQEAEVPDELTLSPATRQFLTRIARANDCNLAAALELVVSEWGNAGA